MGTTGPSSSKSVKETIRVDQKFKGEKSGAEVPQPTKPVKDVEAESHVTGVCNQASKPPEDREKASLIPVNGKKDQSNKSSNLSGGSLASLWGRASTKSKLTSSPAQNSIPTGLPFTILSLHTLLQ